MFLCYIKPPSDVVLATFLWNESQQNNSESVDNLLHITMNGK